MVTSRPRQGLRWLSQVRSRWNKQSPNKIMRLPQGQEVTERDGIGFSAGGLLFPYQLGVVVELRESGLLRETTPLAGASAGALTAATAKAGVSGQDAMEAMKEMCGSLRRFGTAGRLRTEVSAILRDVIPPDAHERLNQSRCHVAVSRVDGFRARPILIDHFEGKEDLIEGLLTSCHIPLYFDKGTLTTTSFRGWRCFDGGALNFLPVPPESEDPLRVTCFPTARYSSFAYARFRVNGLQVDISPDIRSVAVDPSEEPEEPPFTMMEALRLALLPSSDDVLDELFERGKHDTRFWVQRNSLHRL